MHDGRMGIRGVAVIILYSHRGQRGIKRETPRMYAMATRWTFKAGSGEEVLGVTRDEVVPVLEAQRGYLRTVIVQTGSNSFLSLVCWETEDDARRAMTHLAALAIRHLGHLVRDVERLPGPVVYEQVAQGSCL